MSTALATRNGQMTDKDWAGLLVHLEHAGTLTPTGLVLDLSLSYEEYEQIGYALGRLRDMTAWALGDWLLFGENCYGEDKYAQAVEVTGRAKSTLQTYLRVALRIPSGRRRGELTWSHHEAVASLLPPEQDELLKRAVSHGWSVEEMRGMRKGSEEELAQLIMPEVIPSVDDAARDVLKKARRVHGGYLVPGVALDRLRTALGGADD